MEKTTPEITDLLQAWEGGDREALERLMPLVMGEFRRLARGYMRRERPGHTLQTGGLINEAFLRLAGQNRVHWRSRSHFYAIAARCMRLVLIDHAKARLRAKRAGVARQISTRDAAISDEQSEELLALNAALAKLAKKDKRKSKVIELRYFGGFSFEEVADILRVSEATVARDWRVARAWLRRELGVRAGVREL